MKITIHAILFLALMPLTATAHTICQKDDPSSEGPRYMHFPTDLCPPDTRNTNFGGFNTKTKEIKRTMIKNGKKVEVTRYQSVREPLYMLTRTYLDEESCKYKSADNNINMTCEKNVPPEKLLQIGRNLNNENLKKIAGREIKELADKKSNYRKNKAPSSRISNAKR